MLFVTAVLCLLCVPSFGTGTLLTKGSVRETKHADVYYMTEMSDRFMSYMGKKQALLQKFGASEQERLETAVAASLNPADKSLLEMTAKVNEENRLEAQNAFSEMQNFVTTLKQIMGAVGSASSCQDLTCGEHSYCDMDKSLGARCLCSAGYQGNGFTCHTPLQFAMTPLIQTQVAQAHQIDGGMADLRVTTLHGNVVVAVYRDIAKGNKGFAMLGRAGHSGMQWHTPVLFSQQSQAFSPVLVQLLDHDTGAGGSGIAIAFRSNNRGGDGLLLSGRIDTTTGEMKFGSARAFARQQAQAMAMLPLPGSRAAVIFAEHQPQGQPDQHLPGAMYGAALMAQLNPNGAMPEIISKDRFAHGPVARLSVVALSSTSFGVAYRQGAGGPGSEMAEAACILGEARPAGIRFSSNAMLLEPDQAHIWARSLTLVGQNLLSYIYHSGKDKMTKQAILRANPQTHRLEVVHGPVVLAEGPSSVIGSVSFMREDVDSQGLLQQQDRSSVLLTVLGGEGSKRANARLCRIPESGIPSACRELAWGDHNLASVSGASVGDGRFVFVMTDTSGNPFYQLVGLGI